MRFSMKSDSIKIFITGGTIDNLGYADNKDAPINHKSLISSLLKQSRLTINNDSVVLMQKDSRFVNDEDRKEILRQIQQSTEQRIVITHGTLTMTKTASFLAKANLKKTVVLLGSAVPASKENSDALCNLGAAISVVQILPYGVYITMNGKIFTADNVKKNLKTGIFEEI